MMNESDQNELDKLNFNDVSLSKTGEKTTIGSKPTAAGGKTFKKVKQVSQQQPLSVRKSINITEEALAIGKIPTEDVARMIAQNRLNL